MIDPEDLAHCEQAIRHGSRSFHSASLLLPRRVRDPAMALYAFCRLADDAVDLGQQKAEAVLRLHERLDLAYAGTPRDAPADRAFTAMIEATDMPRTLPEALLEGLAWDAMGRRYATLSELRAYSARVASAVGVMMCVLMGVRDANALARACDLGVAMQLTNIARDVGEDAREGRLYLPADWLAEAGIDGDALLAQPEMAGGPALPAIRGRCGGPAFVGAARNICGALYLCGDRPGAGTARDRSLRVSCAHGHDPKTGVAGIGDTACGRHSGDAALCRHLRAALAGNRLSGRGCGAELRTASGLE